MFSSKMFRKIHWFVEFHRLDLLRDVIQVTTEKCPSFRRKTNSPPCWYNETILFFVFANMNQQFILVYVGCRWFPSLTRAYDINGRCPRQKLVFGILQLLFCCQVSQRTDCFLESNLVVLHLKQI